MQSLRGIRDIHESGVDEHSFSEVKYMEYSSLSFPVSGRFKRIVVFSLD